MTLSRLADRSPPSHSRSGLVLLTLALAAAGCAPAVEEQGGEPSAAAGEEVIQGGEGDKAQKKRERSFPPTVAGNFDLAETLYHPGTEDHVTVASTVVKQSLIERGYHRINNEEGYVSQGGLEGMVPLKLYAHGGRGDYFNTATARGQADAEAAGYSFVRVEAYVFPTQQPLTHPLNLYWHAGRGDNFTTAKNGQDAIDAGYTFVRTEGWVFRTTPVEQMRVWWHGGREDNIITVVGSSLDFAAAAAGYVHAGLDGSVLKVRLPGTVPLKNFWSAARGDHYATATAAGEQAARDAGYSFVLTEGYVYSSSFIPRTVALRSFWHAGRGDHMTTVSRAKIARDANYAEVRTEGYAFPE